MNSSPFAMTSYRKGSNSPGKWFVSAPFKLVKTLSLYSSHNRHRLATTDYRNHRELVGQISICSFLLLLLFVIYIFSGLVLA